MKEFNKSVEEFLELVKVYEGLSPVFSFDYKKEEIMLKTASSGFLKLLYANSKVCASLGTNGIQIAYFK